MRVVTEVNIERVEDEDGLEDENRAVFYESCADEIVSAIADELHGLEVEVAHPIGEYSYTLSLDCGTPWVEKEPETGCEGCPEPNGAVEPYVVDFDGRGLTVVRYCEGCAHLALANWSGEVRHFVGKLGGKLSGSLRPATDAPEVTALHEARLAVSDAVSAGEETLKALASFLSDDHDRQHMVEDLHDIIGALLDWRSASEAAVRWAKEGL